MYIGIYILLFYGSLIIICLVFLRRSLTTPQTHAKHIHALAWHTPNVRGWLHRYRAFWKKRGNRFTSTALLTIGSAVKQVLYVLLRFVSNILIAIIRYIETTEHRARRSLLEHRTHKNHKQIHRTPLSEQFSDLTPSATTTPPPTRPRRVRSITPDEEH